MIRSTLRVDVPNDKFVLGLGKPSLNIVCVDEFALKHHPGPAKEFEIRAREEDTDSHKNSEHKD